jgi:Tol biopolymer transport system component
MRLDGSGLRNVTHHPAREYYSRWAPDSRHLAFTSNREPKQYGDQSVANAIYTVALDGTDLRRVYPE